MHRSRDPYFLDYSYLIAIILRMKVSVAEAKNKLTQLLHEVERGERVTICRHGVPIADLVSTRASERKPRQFGTFRNEIIITDPDWAKAQNDVEAWLRGDV